MSAPDEAGDGRRLALVVATSKYSDATLQQLRAPGSDAEAFAEILQDPKLGGFSVLSLVDESSERIKRKIAEFCAEGATSDVALVYFSCHGVIDDRGRLYYATVDTERRWLSVTAVPAQWLNEQLDDCRCRRQLLLLDCCHSGAFAKGAKGDAALALQDRFEGRGRVVMTASRATEYSFEGDRVLGESTPSRFTEAIIDGIRSGMADSDKDGLITVPELYEYAFAHVKQREARQTPGIWMNAAEGRFLVARSPRGAVIDPAPLPEHIQFAIESASRNIRQAAVQDIARLLAGPNPGVALTARAVLQHVAEEDAPAVATAARAALEEHAGREVAEQVRREAQEQARRQAEEQARRETEEQVRRQAEEQVRREREARHEAEEQARREAEETAEREAEQRREAEASRVADETAEREAEQRRDAEASRVADETAEREAEQRRDAEASRVADETARSNLTEHAPMARPPRSDQPTAGPSRGAPLPVGGVATTGKHPAWHRVRQRPYRAVVVIVIVLLLIGGTLAAVLSQTDRPGPDTEGPFVDLTSVGGEYGGTANISTSQEPPELYMSASSLPALESGERRRAFLFDSLSKMRRFTGDPPGEPLGEATRDDYVFADLLANFRSFRYVGLARVGPSGGRLLVYTRVSALREP